MKRVLQSTILFIFYSTLLFAQWSQQASSTAANLQDVHFEDANIGWAVGGSDFFPQSSIILKTVNSGTNWNAQVSPLTTQLNGVSFVNTNQGWAVGSGGKIINTINGGTNWATQPSGIATDLFDVQFINSLVGWAVGDNGKILATTDGGLMWQSQASGTTDPLWSVWFTDSNTGWAVGGSVAFGRSKILKTVNGGWNWVSQNEPTGKMFSDVTFGDNQNGWAVSETGTLIKTANGGTNWATQNSGTAVEWLYTAYAVNPQTAWVGGGGGYIANTINGGTNWTQQVSGIADAIRGIYFVDGNTGWAVGDGGKILKYSLVAAGSITVTSPNGGENWKVGTTQNITWTSSNVTNVKLEYSINNGTNWTQIVASTAASAGSYSWTVPNSETTQSLVKISDAADNTVTDQSNAVFTIYTPTITVTSPNGGENWRIGSTRNITWTSGNVEDVMIEYSINNGTNWTQIIASTAANTGSYSWTVPNSTTAQALVRVTDVADNTILDQSDAVFRIFTQTVSVLFPNGGENWRVGTSQTITWIGLNVANVKIEYTTDNGTNWIQMIASTPTNINGTPNYYAWTIPNTSSANSRVRITNASDPSLSDMSNNTFTILDQYVTLNSPNGGENWKVGTNQNITWTSSNVTNVKLEYSINNGTNWTQIIASTAAGAGSYSWTVPNSITPQALVRITDTSENTVTDQSNAVFTIYTPTVTITAPNGGESWKAGTNQNITWTSSNVTTVKLEYSINNGTNWTQIIASTAASVRSYNWTVPNSTTAQALVRITDTSDNTVKDQSNAVFTISTLDLISPNGGEKLKVGYQYSIKWNSSLNISSVKLYVSTNGGGFWTYIGTSNPGSNSFSWQVIDHPSVAPAVDCKIKIVDVQNINIFDISDANFSIVRPIIYVAYPNESESFISGVQTEIKWSSDYVDNFKIELTTDFGSTWTTIIDNISASGKYLWTVPNLNSDNCLIRISDMEKPTTFDVSNNRFTIKNKGLIVLNPDGGGKWQTGKVQEIKWYSSNVQNVKISYSIDDGLSWASISLSTLASLRTLLWSVVDNPTTKLRMKIKDASSATEDISNSVSTIAKLELTQPNGGEYCSAGRNYKIKWLSANVEKVKLEYSNDAGITWGMIADILSAQPAEYNWLIPNEAASENAIIRVSDAIENSILDESNDIFRITNQQTITLISPIGGEWWIAGDTHLITWTSTNIENVKIEYSADNGAHWTELAASIPAIQGNHQWRTPTQKSVNYKVRISNSQLPEVNTESNIFNIADPPSITILNQFNNLQIIGGTTFEIKWSSVNVQNVRISFTSNANVGNPRWVTIKSSMSASEGSFLWEVPMVTSPFCKIRISDVSVPEIFKESNIFSIKDFGIHLLSPNGGEKLQSKSKFPIVWKFKPGVSRINIYYTISSRGKYLVAQNVNANAGGFLWDVPAITTNNCRIIVTNSTNTAHSDTSDTQFSVIENLEYKWKQINDFGNTFEMYFMDENRGFRIGYDEFNTPRLLQTTDGGASWLPVESLRREYVKDFSFSSNLVGFTIFKGGKIYKTIDGGDSWLQTGNPILSIDESHSIFSVNQAVCYLAIKDQSSVFGSVFDFSAIYKTNDGGNSWDQLISFSNNVIKSIFFISENVGWITLGKNRVIQKTTDGGLSWNEQSYNQTESYFNSIWFVSPTHGFACGEDYLGHTTDGGQTWIEDHVDSEFGTVNMKFKRLFFINDIGWATGDILEPSDYYGPDDVYIGIAKTTDGGNNWKVDLKAGGNGSGPIFMLNPSFGWMNGSSTFKYGSSSLTVISPNGGEKIVRGDNVNLRWYTDANFSDKVAISYRSKGFYSSETIFENIPNIGSYTFSSSLLNCRDCILKVSAANASDETDSAITIKVAFRSGYVEKDVPRNNSISAISISGANVYLNGNKAFKSSNKGNSWQEVLAENNISNFEKYFIDDQNVWLFENINNTNSWKNRKSTNGGSSWQDVYSHAFDSFELSCGNSSSTYLPTITSIDYKLYKRNNNIAIIQNYSLLSKKCYAHGWFEYDVVDQWKSGNALLISTDQGQTWLVNSLVTSSPELGNFDPFPKMKRRAFSFATNLFYYFVKGDAELWRNVIGQNPTSTKCLDLGEQKINAVYFVDYNKGYVVGDNGLIYKTNSGGASWGQLNSNTTANLNAVYFPNAQTGYVVGNGVILKTTNGGTNWVVQESGLRANLISVNFSDANEGWILGDNGIVIYTSTGGELLHIAKETASIDELPKEYNLSQNYPNPFNPTTTISYSLPMNSRVKIIIYNILGQVVAQLSDEIQTAGYYNKIWNANNIASGVYLLRIEAESLESNEMFVKSVKMLLVK